MFTFTFSPAPFTLTSHPGKIRAATMSEEGLKIVLNVQDKDKGAA